MRQLGGGVGWAARSLDETMQRAESGGLALWQLASIGAALVSAVALPLGVVIGAHVAVLVVGVVIVARRGRTWPLLLMVYAATVVDYAATVDLSSALGFGTALTATITSAVPVLVVRRPWTWLFVAVGVAVPVVCLPLLHGRVGAPAIVPTVVTAAVLVAAGVALMRTLRAFAEGADAEEAAVAREQEGVLLGRAAARVAAEHARVLHDTLINTLGAIAAGGGAIGDRELVRARSARDVEAVAGLLDGRPDTVETGLGEIVVPPDRELRRTGLAEAELDEIVAALPLDTGVALRRAVGELVRNAVAHSGSRRIEVDARRDGSSLVVTVADRGRGFDGVPVPGRGLAESVVARAHDAGIGVSIRAAHGTGTAVELRVPTDLPDGEAGEGRRSTVPSQTVDRIRRRACWVWAVVMIGFGVVTLAIDPPRTAATTVEMLAVVAGLVGLAAIASRGERELPGWIAAVIVAGVPIAFVAGVAGIRFDSAGVGGWPVISATPLLVVLLAIRRTRTAFLIGMTALVAAVAASAVVAGAVAPSTAAVIVAGGAIQLVILGAWFVFHHDIAVIGERFRRARLELAGTLRQRARQQTAATTRTRWIAAGARAAVEILRRIADGASDPSDPAVRVECASAERYLRQVLLLNTDAVHLGPWLGLALGEARARSVALDLRGCAEDAPDEASGARLGRLVLAAVESVPAGTELRVGVFTTPVGIQFLLVAPRDALAGVADGFADAPVPRRRQLADQDLIEVTLDAAPARGVAPA